MTTPPTIPDHWTAQEAMAVFEFINAIQEEIWNRYGVQLGEIFQAELSTNPADWESSGCVEDLNDDMPF